MKEFKVTIREILERDVIVKAKNDIEALLKVREQYDNEEIILDSNDYIGVDFEAFKTK